MPNECDARRHAHDAVLGFFERVQTISRTTAPAAPEWPRQGLIELARAEVPPLARDMCEPYLKSAALLGQRTAELHRALAAAPDQPAFRPESFSEHYQRALYQELRNLVRRTLRFLRSKLAELPEETRPDGLWLVGREQELVERCRRLLGRKLGGARIRCHGEYHLGQVLYTGRDFVIFDFEGALQQPLSERRIKRSPLRDVASMIRSFDYASQTVLWTQLSGLVLKEQLPAFQQWAHYWWLWTSVRFLQTYLGTLGPASIVPASPQEIQLLLDMFLLENGLRALGSELTNRPAWVRVPLDGIRRLLEAGG